MAYIVGEEEEEDQADAKAVPQESSGLVGGSAGGGGAATQAAAPSAGSDFVSFDQYYAANADAAGRSANQLADAASKSAADAELSINTARDTIENATGNGGKISLPAGPLEQQDPRPRTTKAATPLDSKPIDPKITPQHERDMGNWTGTTEAEAQAKAAQTYTGPGSLLDAQFGDLSGKVEHAGQQLGSLQSPEGIQAALHGASDGGVSDGLDAALVGRAGAGRFRELKDRYGSLTKLLDDRVASTSGMIDRKRGDVATEAGRYRAILDAAEKARQAKALTNPPPGSTDGGGSRDELDDAEDFGSDVTSTAADVAGFIPGLGPILKAGINKTDEWADKQRAYNSEIRAWNRAHPNGPSWVEAHPKATVFNPLGD